MSLPKLYSKFIGNIIKKDDDTGFTITYGDNSSEDEDIASRTYLASMLKDYVSYGTCTTAASIAAKTVTVDNFSLKLGKAIIVRFKNSNTANNLTLNVNGTGAKAIYYFGKAIDSKVLQANKDYTFVYDGGQYCLVSAGDLVSQYVSNVNNTFPILFTPTANATIDQNAQATIFSNKIQGNPNTGELKSSSLTTTNKIIAGSDISSSGKLTATSDISGKNITSNGNLTVTGKADITGNITGNNATFTGDIKGNSLNIDANATINGNNNVKGDISGKNVTASGNITADGNASITGNVTANIVSVNDTVSTKDLVVTGTIQYGGDFESDNISAKGEISGGSLVIDETIMAKNLAATNNATIGNAITCKTLEASESTSTKTLNVSENANVTGNISGYNVTATNLTSTKDFIASGNSTISGNEIIEGNSTVTGNIKGKNVTATEIVTAKNLTVSTKSTTNELVVNGNTNLKSNTQIGGNATVTGSISGASADITGDITANNITASANLNGKDLSISNNAKITKTLSVENVNATGSIQATLGTIKGKTLEATSTLKVGDSITATGPISGTSITASDSLNSTGNTNVGGNLTVNGITTLNQDTTVTGRVSATDIKASKSISGASISVTGNGTIGETISAKNATITASVTSASNTVSGKTTTNSLEVVTNADIKQELKANSASITTSVSAASATLTGNLSVGGNAIITGNNTVTGNVSGKDITASNKLKSKSLETTTGSITTLTGSDFTASKTIKSQDVTATRNITASNAISGNSLSITTTAKINGNITTDNEVIASEMTATAFHGLADKATQDGQGNIITDTYLTVKDFDAVIDSVIEPMTSLPATGVPYKIYLIPNQSGEADNVYDEYFWNKVTNKFELAGYRKIDLSPYAKLSQSVVSIGASTPSDITGTRLTLTYGNGQKNVIDTKNTVYEETTDSVAGLFATAYKKKLDNIEETAQRNPVLTFTVADKTNNNISEPVIVDTHEKDGKDAVAKIELHLAGTIKAELDGNSATTTKLKKKIKINNTEFDGSLDITTNKWGKLRKVTVSDSSSSNTGAITEVEGDKDWNIKLPETIKGTLDGNSATTTKFEEERHLTVQDNTGSHKSETIVYDGTSDGTLVLPKVLDVDITGNAATATKLLVDPNDKNSQVTTEVEDLSSTSGTTRINSATNLGSDFSSCSTIKLNNTAHYYKIGPILIQWGNCWWNGGQTPTRFTSSHMTVKLPQQFKSDNYVVSVSADWGNSSNTGRKNMYAFEENNFSIDFENKTYSGTLSEVTPSPDDIICNHTVTNCQTGTFDVYGHGQAALASFRWLAVGEAND